MLSQAVDITTALCDITSEPVDFKTNRRVFQPTLLGVIAEPVMELQFAPDRAIMSCVTQVCVAKGALLNQREV